ncbi:hypothetical protein [Streptomyces sp. NPDC093544]|uniref:hypothetical protein n=1 Tax=Streptomyces sp. NPDC093544 TaxID=3155200 RepID=UPI003445023A
MAESVPVRCPACRREHLYAAQSYPCVCGTPVTPPLDRLAEPAAVTHRTWDEDWVSVRCEACGREGQWPAPELGCSCGTELRIPVRGIRRPRRAQLAPGTVAEANHDTDEDTRTDDSTLADEDTRTDDSTLADEDTRTDDGIRMDDDNRADEDTRAEPAPGTRTHPTDGSPRRDTDSPPHTPKDTSPGTSPAPRPAFQPVTIRTARDAVTAAALYLRWLGYRDIRRADQRPPTGIGLAARGILAQVDPTVRPASLRDVECLWLTAMTESAECVYFSLSGFADDARALADTLGVPLFVLDLTGTPQPVNTPADELLAPGA